MIVYADAAGAAAATPVDRSIAHYLVLTSQTFSGSAGRPVAGPSEHEAVPARGCAVAAYGPQTQRPLPTGTGCCSSEPPTGRHSAEQPESILQNTNGSAASIRAQKFPSNNTMSIALSSSAPERSLLNRESSYSNSMSRVSVSPQ